MDIQNFIKDKRITLLGTKMILLNGKRTPKFNFSLNNMLEISKNYQVDLESLGDNDFNVFLFEETLYQLNKDRLEAEDSEKSSFTIEKLNSPEFVSIEPNNLLLVHFINDSTSKGDSVWLDSRDFTELPFLKSNRSILASISSQLGGPKNMIGWEAERVRHLVRTFRPDTVERIFSEDTEVAVDKIVPITYYNIYNPPLWRLKHSEDQVPKGYPELVTRLFESLLPVEQERKMVRRFFYLSIFDRSPIHLILHGREGNGKTTLAKLWIALLGEENCLFNSKDALKSGFDSGISNKKGVFYDESGPDTNSTKDKLKLYSTDYFAVSQKFKDTNKSVRSYASHFMANNFKKLNKLRPTDRVFFTPDTSPLKLENNNLTNEEIGWVHDFQKIPHDFLAQTAYALKDEFQDDETPMSRMLTKTFMELIHHHLDYIEKAIVELCRIEESFNNRAVKNLAAEYAAKDKVSGYKPNFRSKLVVEFVENYEKELQTPLCKLEVDGNSCTFYSKVFKKKQ